MTRPLDDLMQKEMTRKEFLAALGFGVASIMGFSTIIRLLTGHSADSLLHNNKSSSLGYGSSAYGGGTER
jgi:hypothetical protein